MSKPMLWRRRRRLLAVGCVLLIGGGPAPAAGPAPGLAVRNGWFTHNGRVLWGYAQHNGWWRPGQRPNLTRRAPGRIGPNRTEDLEKLTGAMLRFAYPGFEHNFGLWRDRRRDAHDTVRRKDARAVPPLLEQPWARSGQGRAWDGLSQYDLTTYNAWYFDRLKQFAALCSSKGAVLFHNCYMQHALLETDAHYVDFPWRPGNCIQDTGMPRRVPAANAFYDVSHPVRRRLHQAYIRKCLDALGDAGNVVFMCSQEYTGPLSFMQFWLDTVFEWEDGAGRDVHVAVGGCKDVVDAVLADPVRGPRVSVIDMRHWWRRPDGALFAPQSGREIPGRFAGAFGLKPNPGLYAMLRGYTGRGMGRIGPTSVEQIHRQARAYRARYPDKALVHGIAGARQAAWAFLMGGGSMMIGQLAYPNRADPASYISPEKCRAIQPTYDFIRTHLADSLAGARPRDLVLDDPARNWSLSQAGRMVLVYSLAGGRFRVDLSDAPGPFHAEWFDPRTGELSETHGGMVRGGRPVAFEAPGRDDWALWLTKAADARFAKWSTIELAFAGPERRGAGDPNPFAIPLDVTFTSPGGKPYRVPGFYDGDGRGGLDGHVWKVRFSADETGTWSYRTTSPESSLDGKTGRFTVCPVPAGAQGFWKWGRLESVGAPGNRMRYLKFRDGPYWLKAGCDDPENFLGKARHYDTLAERKQAVDYLAARGVNSLYMMTHNIDGDDKDVWPWLGETPAKAKANAGADARFDIAKLRQWRQIFEHMQAKGVVPYLVLEDDSAWKRYDHARYYRELIARFGDLPALLLNFGEEHNENYSLDEALAWMRQLDRIDPYDHPRGIHNVNRPTDAYIDSPYVHFTSIQTQAPHAGRALAGALAHNTLAIRWIDRCRARARRVLVVGFDEGRPIRRRQAWWSAYLGGGVWEAHVSKPYDRPMAAWAPVWTALGGARRFMESLPFWDMDPHNERVVAGKAFCLAKPGEAYALYLPDGGGVTVDLAPGSTYECMWWNPANGKDGRFEAQRSVAGGRQTLAPPGRGDWALRIVSDSFRLLGRRGLGGVPSHGP